MPYTNHTRWGSIETYYRFKVEVNPEEDTYEFIRLRDKGRSTPFDKIYYEGEIVEYNSPGQETPHGKFGNVSIKFKIDNGSTEKSSIQVFRGNKGIGTVYKNSQIFYSVLYRQPEPDEYEVFFINRRPGTSVDYLGKLKEGRLDNEIKKLLDS